MNAVETGQVDVDQPEVQPLLGQRLKVLRASRGLSLKKVADVTGLSASFLSMVETGQTELTVGRLRALADFYEVAMTDLVPGREKDGPVVLRRDSRSTTESPDRKVRTESLSTWNYGDLTGGFIHLEVDGQLSGLSSQAGSMFVLVLAGELAIQFGDDTSVALGEGDAVWFEASRRHRYLNTGGTASRLITFKSAGSS